MIILQCIKDQDSKLRIRFYCHVENINKKLNFNLYDNKLNCKFPKNRRKDGRYYIVDDLSVRNYGTPYYKTIYQSLKVFENKKELDDFLNPPKLIIHTNQISEPNRDLSNTNINTLKPDSILTTIVEEDDNIHKKPEQEKNLLQSIFQFFFKN